MPISKNTSSGGRVRVDIRVTATEKAQIEAKAKAKGLGVQQYARRQILSAKTPVLPEFIALDNLRMHMDELKLAYASGAPDEVKSACVDQVVRSVSGLLVNSRGR